MPVRPPNVGAVSWSSSLRLPKSTFPHHPLPADVPRYLKASTSDLYEWQTEARADQAPFFLHDGPPYANGSLHIGHALNKILKDIICRVKLQQGKRVVYVPGWDCHGLPIEVKALEKQREQTEHTSNPHGIKLDAIGTRNAARQLAADTVKEQMLQFKRWGIMADWKRAWKTMDKTFEIKQLEVFQEMVKRNLIFRRNKPVYWSPSSMTALAEAELEYVEDHKSTAAYVEFPIVSWGAELRRNHPEIDGRKISAVIWTTTPWTLPANRAIAFNKAFEYSVLRSTIAGNTTREFIIAKSRLNEFKEVFSQRNDVESKINGPSGVKPSKTPPPPEWTSEVVVESILGSELEDACYVNSFRSGLENVQPFIHADFVSADSGTGLVHMAPGHGMDDYEVCKQHGISPDAPVDDLGRFTADAFPSDPKSLTGLHVLKAGTDAVLELLQANGRLITAHKYKHKYPYDWRTKLPVIVRATEQWFADVGSVKDVALERLRAVEFIPESGRSRLESFVKGRSEWCISRQRAWGVPIPALYDEDGKGVLTEASVAHIVSVIKERGIDAWWTDAPDDPAWIYPGLDGHYARGKDTMDVWFDSGSSWTQTPEQADVYIEGTDQHRGWFQSSLLTHTCASEINGAPYKTLITHGFTLDKHGKKMSKSVGNIIAPCEIMDGTLLPEIYSQKKKQPAVGLAPSGKPASSRREQLNIVNSNFLGADALRYWVASCDYTHDVVIGQKVLISNYAALSKYRTIIKMLLGSIHMSARTSQMTKLDQIALSKLKKVMDDVASAYANFEFYKGITLINRWVNADLSAFYLEAIKDRLYCGDGGGVLEEIFYGFLRMLTPILPQLVEEAWNHRPRWMEEEQHIHPFHQAFYQPLTPRDSAFDERIANDLPWLLSANTAIKAAQEQARAKKLIGSSLQSSVILSCDDTEGLEVFRRYEDELEAIFVVSSVVLDTASVPECIGSALFASPAKGAVYILPPKDAKCPRCWRYVAPAEDHLCSRCEDAVGK